MILPSNRTAQVTTLSLLRVHFTVRIHFPIQMSPQPSRSQCSNQTESETRPRRCAHGLLALKDFDEQFGSAIGDHVGLRKMRPTVDEDQKFHNPSKVIQIADGGLKSGK